MTNIFEKIVNDLNLEQKDVVESEDNLYVNACPGSGKTRVLTRKIAYQAIKHDGSLKRIIAITYTNRAAEEIKERLSLLSIDDDINIWVGTIHQFC
ncbi:TPA: UvrD-helicase domain-containing protein, partial [Enterococcus faecium]|nr:UvrD-helicase domain-containing protein [Enterococcus faecium]